MLASDMLDAPVGLSLAPPPLPPAWIRREDALARRIATAFFAYGLFAVLFLAINLPPFQNPDELSHFARAAQLSRGGLVGHRFLVTEDDGTQTLTAGGKIDPAILQASDLFEAIRFHAETAVTRDALATDPGWSDTRLAIAFPATAMYPPFLYVPSAIGIAAGRAAGASVVQTLMLSRLLTGMASIAVGTVAIACAGASSIWIFALLTLPMSLSLMASSSQDGLILALSGLAGGILARSRARDGVRSSSLAWMVVSLGLIGMGRPPYGALALLPLALGTVRWRSRLIMAAIIAACTLIWSAISGATAMTNYGAFFGADPPAQVAHLWADPLCVLGLARQVWIDGSGLVTSFVGVLGWLDTPLPDAYYTAAEWMIALAFVTAAFGTYAQPSARFGRLVIAAGVLASVIGVFAMIYVTWTKPGADTINGVQGRYFIPLGLAGAGLIPTLGSRYVASLHRAMVVAVVAFPLVTLAVTMRTVVLRYYLGVS